MRRNEAFSTENAFQLGSVQFYDEKNLKQNVQEQGKKLTIPRVSGKD